MTLLTFWILEKAPWQGASNAAAPCTKGIAPTCRQ